MKDHVRLLVIGDEGVGKSSLISSYISRHFPNEVPPVMTDAVIPPQTTSNDVCVTVMDSSARVVDREVLKQKILSADSIIALYDVTRPESFDNLIHVWFPLLTEAFGEGHTRPVIVAGTKTDLTFEDNDVERLKDMLEMCPFVLVCLRCSALQLQDVEDIFHYGVDAVTYPLEPIFDIFTHEFKPACRRAFLRIFRALDLDHDNHLSDAEMRETEARCFNLQINDDELVAMKRQIASTVPDGLSAMTEDGRLGMVTFEGFLGLVKMIVEETSFRIPWQILRRFDYDDDLDYMVPEEVSEPPRVKACQSTELSADARDFLLGMARIARWESEKLVRQQSPGPGHESPDDVEGAPAEGGSVLTSESLNHIFSVIPSDVVHPWSQPPAFMCVWREDSVEQRLAERSLQQSILLSSLPHIGANITFEAWLTQWHVLASTNPVLTQELLFRLGYIERLDLGVVATSGTIAQIAAYSPPVPSPIFGIMFQSSDPPPAVRTTVNACVLGGNCVGKSSFVWSLSGLAAPGRKDVEMGLGNEKPQDTVVVGGCASHQIHTRPVTAVSAASKRSRSKGFSGGRDSVAVPQRFRHLYDSFYLCASAIPLEHVQSQPRSKKGGKSAKTASTRGPESTVLAACDVAVLMFQCGDMDSLRTALELEQTLPTGTPRLFLASKADRIPSKAAVDNFHSSGALHSQHEIVMEEAALHLAEHGLPDLVLVSSTTGEGVAEAVVAISAVAADPSTGVPLKQRRDNGSGLQASVAVAVASLASLSIAALAYYLWAYQEREVRQWLTHLCEAPLIGSALSYMGVRSATTTASDVKRIK